MASSPAPEATVEDFRANLRVIAALAAGSPRGAALQIEQSPNGPQELLRFLRRQNLEFYFATQLSAPELRRVIPGEALRRLEENLDRKRARQQRLITELTSLQPIFDEASIEFIVLKGPALGERFFGGLHNRAYGDLDILVRRSQLSRTHRVLRDRGYWRRSRVFINDAITTRFAHGYDYKRSDIPVDLHWSLGTHISYDISYDAIWNTRQPCAIGEVRCPTLSDEYMLLNLLLSFFEDLDRGAGRIRSVIDIHHAVHRLEPRLDWRGFFARRAAESLDNICEAGLSLMLRLFQCTDAFPRLVQAMGEGADRSPSDWSELEALIEAPPGRLRNKLWAARSYQCPRMTSLAWWSISLPIRLMVYRPRKRPGRLDRARKDRT